MSEILALGDCNTLGIEKSRGNTYVEKFAAALQKSVQNCGYTMSTTREMRYFFQDFYQEETEIILIQYGLVASWKTFKYAPYVLYYPENRQRKILRKIVKKYKKTAKKIGLNEWLGVANVVPAEEYEKNITDIIRHAGTALIVLIDTVPNLDISRNPEIRHYNEILSKLSQKYDNVMHIAVYDDFVDKPEYYLDATHINDAGYELIVGKILDRYREQKREKQ